MAAAIRYVLSRSRALVCNIEDGYTKIDNGAEHALRAVALGRNKRTSICSPDQAQAANAPQPFIMVGMAKLNGVDPEAYLSIVLAPSLTIASANCCPETFLQPRAQRLSSIQN